MYTRKTVDEYQIHANYGEGFEEVTCADSRREARELLKEYRANEPGVPVKLVKVRIRITPEPGINRQEAQARLQDAPTEEQLITTLQLV